MDDKHEKFFQLLRYSIGASEEAPVDISDGEWNDIYEMAIRQSISGLLFHGIRKGGLEPPFDVKVEWMMDSEMIKDGNLLANEVAVRVSRYFEERGFRGCILKGQGNTLSYPDPYVRAIGDIDIWLEGGREKVLEMVNEMWPGMKQRAHHVEAPPMDGIPVEVHFKPSNMRAPWRNSRLQEWFESQAPAQFEHRVMLPGNAGEVCVPTADFNVIFQLQHMYSHLFTEGFGLRQVVDYYFVLRMGQGARCKEQELRYLGLEKIAGAMMWVLHEVLGLEEQYLIAPMDEKEGRFLLHEIMIGGNFGHYDTRLGSKDDESMAHRYFRMTLRNMRFIKHYPEEALCEPFFRTWHFFWRLGH